MTYLQTNTNRTRGRQTRIVALSFLCGIVLIAAVVFIVPHFFSALFTSIARPFWRSEFSILSGSLHSPDQLLRENEDLKRQVADADVRLETIQSVEMENNELKAILGRASTTPYVLAAVLVRPPAAVYDEFIIDAGADHNFAVGNTAYAPGNVLIGEIVDVQSQTSKVRLFSSPGQRYEVRIGTAHTPATAIGRGGGQYRAELPRDVKVAEGDFVTIPSLTAKPFGIVTSVVSDPTQPFETILFAPSVNVYEVRWMLVDTKVKM